MTLLAYLKGIVACLKQSCESAKFSHVSNVSLKEIREAQSSHEKLFVLWHYIS